MADTIIKIKSKLLKLLQEEKKCARMLLNSLRGESSALMTLDENLISINSINKKKLIAELQLASRQRIDFMHEHGLETEPGAIHNLLAEADADRRLRENFQELKRLAQECFAENRLVGQLINRRTSFITQALSALTPSADLKTLTYGEDGKTKASKKSRNLGNI